MSVYCSQEVKKALDLLMEETEVLFAQCSIVNTNVFDFFFFSVKVLVNNKGK